MGDVQVGLADGDIVVEEDVDVDEAVVIDASCRLLRASELALYLLRGFEELPRREVGGAADGGIDETMVGAEAPGLCFEESRLAHDGANQLSYPLDGPPYVAPTVPEVTAQTQIYGVETHQSSTMSMASP